MDYKLEQLIDFPLFQTLQDKLNEIYPFPSAIIDNDGKILTATAWQDICTKFHRVNKLSELECIKSDRYIISHIKEANPAVSYRCPHGMIDTATPIIIEGKHLGNFFTGQLFLEPPDLEFFRKQAVVYGFNEKDYLEAVSKVPVWTRDKLDKYLAFIKNFVEILAGIGLRNLQEIEAKRELQEINQALAESESQFRSVFENSHDAMGVSKQGKTIFVNQAYAEMFGFSKKEELIGKSILEVIAPTARPDIIEKIRKRTNHEFVPSRYETIGLRKSGEEFFFDITVDSFFQKGELLTIAMIRDTTERKKFETELQLSLREKETLLRELYHRTKNNMQVICSMLALKSLDLNDEATKTVFREMENRIHSMALVHQKLYSSKNLSNISLKEYVHDLSRLLLETYQTRPGQIEVVYEIEDISVLIDIAIPCGLLLNELLSNSIKYAFPGNRNGRITIRIKMTSDSTIEFHVSDNGIGLPPDFDLKKDSKMGIQTILGIGSHQLQGEVKFETNNGTACFVKFKNVLYNARV